MRAYHGTSTTSLNWIFSGRPAEVVRAFTEANVSLGGAYVTKDNLFARAYALHAADVQGGRPAVLEVEIPSSDLLPDEDWVVKAAEAPRLSPRLQQFMDDLFKGYLGEGWSLSDHYKTKYAELNKKHGITWRDSWRWSHSARVDRPIRPEDVIRTKELLTK